MRSQILFGMIILAACTYTNALPTPGEEESMSNKVMSSLSNFGHTIAKPFTNFHGVVYEPVKQHVQGFYNKAKNWFSGSRQKRHSQEALR